MKIDDYSKYYIQGSDHYLIPKDVFKELFYEMVSWRDESEKLKKQLEERTKMYQNAYKYGQRMEDVTVTLKAEQKEIIKYLEDMLDDENDIFSVVRVKDVLQKYKEIVGVYEKLDETSINV